MDSPNKPWLDAYPDGVPAEIDPDQYRSLKALLEHSFERFANLPAFRNFGTTMTYREVDRLSLAFAAYLQSVAGLERGDRVAVMMPNLLQYPVTVFGILRAGMTVVNVNPLYTPRELGHQLEDSGARAIVVVENFAATVQRARRHGKLDKVLVTRMGDHLPWLQRTLLHFLVKHVRRLVPAFDLPDAVGYLDALEQGRRCRYEDVEIAPDDVAFLQYTGGTTGVAKGAMLTHGNMVANVVQAVAWARPFINGPGDVVVTALPLYHIFSLTANLLSFVEFGGLDLLITDPRDLPAFVKVLRKTPFTYVTGVNTLYNALLNTPGFETLDFSRLKVSMGGGMAVQRSVAERWQALTGVTLSQGYGLTETSPIVCANPLDRATFDGSVGVPLPSTDVRICDEAGRELPWGEVGEICVRGPQVMPAYWQRPEETEAVLQDGWLRTGDIGRMNERGYVFIEDRKKDMILVSGFNVYPNEVEDVAAGHPGVLEAAAIGVPDEHSGEVVKLFVVRKDPGLTESAVLDWCREQLTGYKLPRYVEFRDELPKTNVGKVLRRALREPLDGD